MRKKEHLISIVKKDKGVDFTFSANAKLIGIVSFRLLQLDEQTETSVLNIINISMTGEREEFLKFIYKQNNEKDLVFSFKEGGGNINYPSYTEKSLKMILMICTFELVQVLLKEGLGVKEITQKIIYMYKKELI